MYEPTQNGRIVKKKDKYLRRFFKLATGVKIYVNSLNLHEIKNGFLQEYTGDFEMIGL